MFSESPVIRSLSTFIFPYIVLYSVYIQLNGEISPGGGFQAGVIFASAIIAINLVSNKIQAISELTVNSLLAIMALGVFIYAGVGLVSFFHGSYYLDYYSLANDRHTSQNLGIFIIELGVGLTVSSVMCLIYFLFKDA
jgi:multicomponent Na+:H+ antiporter subunit B